MKAVILTTVLVLSMFLFLIYSTCGIPMLDYEHLEKTGILTYVKESSVGNNFSYILSFEDEDFYIHLSSCESINSFIVLLGKNITIYYTSETYLRLKENIQKHHFEGVCINNQHCMCDISTNE